MVLLLYAWGETVIKKIFPWNLGDKGHVDGEVGQPEYGGFLLARAIWVLFSTTRVYVNRLDCKEYPVIQILDGRTVEGGIWGLWQPNGNIRGLGIFFFLWGQ